MNTTTLKKCLIVVDYQNDFVTGSLGYRGAEDLDERIAAKIKEYHDRGDDVIFTLDTHESNYLDTYEGHMLPTPHCLDGSDGWELYGKTSLAADFCDINFKKNTFGSIDLFKYLTAHKYFRIELCGLVSHICVLANAIIARTARPDTPVVIDATCTGAADKEMTEKAFDVMETCHITIMNRDK